MDMSTGKKAKSKHTPVVYGQAPRRYMMAAPIGAARKKHPGKAIMAGKYEYYDQMQLFVFSSTWG